MDFSHPSDATSLDGMLGLPRDGDGGLGSVQADLALGPAVPHCPAESLRGLCSPFQGNLRGGGWSTEALGEPVFLLEENCFSRKQGLQAGGEAVEVVLRWVPPGIPGPRCDDSRSSQSLRGQQIWSSPWGLVTVADPGLPKTPHLRDSSPKSQQPL